MAIKVLAPSLGEGVDELTIVKWLKKEGDPIKELESLLEVETDKVVTEIPSPATGTLLKCLVSENGTVTVGEVMAWIGKPGESLPDAHNPRVFVSEEANHLEVPAVKIEPNNNGDPGRRLAFISPVVAKIARERNVDLAKISGTGLNGRVTKLDILNFIQAGEKEAPQADSLRDRVIPLNAIRKTIAERMVLSKQISPHVMTVMEADISQVAVHRSANKEIFARDGVNLTFTAYFVSAVVAGLKAFPQVNSSWSEEGIIIHSSYNIGMATSQGEDGLIVPVIKNADRLSLSGIAKMVNDLAVRARSNKLQPSEVKGGTFTLTNHGISRSLFAMPIIYQPQCGILGTGMIQKRPVVVTDAQGNDAIAIRPMIYLSFVFDHRILDGVIADWFLSKVVKSLENWI